MGKLYQEINQSRDVKVYIGIYLRTGLHFIRFIIYIFLHCLHNVHEFIMHPPVKTVEEKEVRIPTTWIHRLSKELLIGNLKSMGLDNQGTIDELRKRFSTGLKLCHSSIQNPAQTTPTNDIQITQSKISTVEKVCKWKLTYDDGADPVAFLERLQELQECYDIKDADMLIALPLVFKNNALLWFRNNKGNWNTWQDFISDFKFQYRHTRYERQIEDEIRSRHQHAQESFREYLTVMSTLLRRGKPISSSDKYDRIYENMQPAYKLFIPRDPNVSITELARKADAYELIIDEQKKFPVQSSSVSRSSIKNNQRVSSKHVNIAQTQSARHTNKNRCKVASTVKPKPSTSTNEGNDKLSEPDKRCWKCSQTGHFRRGCRNATKIFCGRCGKLGVLGRDCMCQKQQSSSQPDPIHGPKNKSQAAPSTNIHGNRPNSRKPQFKHPVKMEGKNVIHLKKPWKEPDLRWPGKNNINQFTNFCPAPQIRPLGNRSESRTRYRPATVFTDPANPKRIKTVQSCHQFGSIN